jgi:thioredoxin reductase (NADPH)
MENMRAQAMRFGAEMVDDDIVEVDLTGDIKLLTDSSGTVHCTKTVIVTTGSGYRKLGLDQERTRSPAAASPGARPASASSPATTTSWSSAAETPRWKRKRPPSSPARQIRDHRLPAQHSRLPGHAEPRLADDKVSFAFDSEITELREENGMLAGLLISTGRFSR